MTNIRILIHAMVFSPDGVSTAYLYNDIALAFKKSGYDVVVLTTTPHFNLVESALSEQPLRWGIPGLYKRSSFSGIPVYHVLQKKFKSTPLRLVAFAYWHFVSFFIALFLGKINVILSPSPPLTVGWINLLLGKLKRCKVVYNVQEIYPDILGLKKGLAFKALSAVERSVYKGSDAVTTIDKVFYDTIVGRFRDRSRLYIIPNFVDTDLYHPMEYPSGLDSRLFPVSDSLKVLYAGNIGFAQSWEPLISLALRTSGCGIEYYVIGEGVRKNYLESQKEQMHLDNLHLIPYQSRELMPSILAYSDVQFIFMNPDMDMQGFPSKVYTVMACGKPLLVCSGEGTPIVEFLSPIGCAKLVTMTDYEDKVERMAEWLTSVERDELKNMGRRGLGAVSQCYTKEKVTGSYVGLIESLME